MDELIAILSKYDLDDAIAAEESDRQFSAISGIFGRFGRGDYYFPLIVVNSLICYQLSGTGEDYWGEFSDFALGYDFPEEFDFNALYDFFKRFLPQSKGNKRLLNMKIPRLKKTEALCKEMAGNEEHLYKNLIVFQDILARHMKQDKESKTILFALKMFHYGARIRYGYFERAPFGIGIPVDSRLMKIERRYNTAKLKSQDFWKMVSERSDIPALHLDAILWTRCDDFVCF